MYMVEMIFKFLLKFLFYLNVNTCYTDLIIY